jgi:hypothetical protein
VYFGGQGLQIDSKERTQGQSLVDPCVLQLRARSSLKRENLSEIQTKRDTGDSLGRERQ